MRYVIKQSRGLSVFFFEEIIKHMIRWKSKQQAIVLTGLKEQSNITLYSYDLGTYLFANYFLKNNHNKQ